MERIAITLLVAAAAGAACGQTDETGQRAFDECGTLVRGAECVLFEGAGGKYYVPELGDFQVGDAVRAVGTLDPSCVTICRDADGCLLGGALYDPAVFPCGQPLPRFPQDILTNACSLLSTGLVALSLGGLWYARRRRAVTGPDGLRR